jgi:hypothetical protein
MMPVSNREGERHWNSKLSEEEVTFLLTVHDEYMQERRALKLMSPDVVCRDLNYRSTDIYYDIINGKHRPRIPQFIRDLVLDNEAKRKLKREVVKRLSPEVIAPQYGISAQHYRDIVNCKYWKSAGEIDNGFDSSDC